MMSAVDGRARTRRGRIGLTVFFLVLVVACLAGTRYLAPRLQQVQQDNAPDMPVWKILEVTAGDRLTVSDGSVTNAVLVRGIGCPPTERGARLDETRTRLGMPEDDLIRKGQVAGKALKTWVYRRKALLEDRTDNPDGTWTAFVAVGGVDVGRKMLQNGQAFALDQPHPRREAYQRYEADARAKEIGLWRMR